MSVPPTSHRAGPVRARRSFGSLLAGTAMNLLAATGLTCVVLVVAAVVFHISLIMFKTGSMSPAIPAGSVAIVRKISADRIEVGDIVTVDRPGELPVTHRVIAVHPQLAGEALIEMRGDANPELDPGVYRVNEGRRVMWSMPGAAKFLVWLSNPYVLGTLTLGASALVLWAFWPRGDRRFPVSAGLPGCRAAGLPEESP